MGDHQYSLVIEIEKGRRDELVRLEYSLGLRKTVTDSASGDVSNVAFVVKPYNLIGASMTFGWDESYQIGSTTEVFKEGGVVSQSMSDVLPIAFHEGAFIGKNFNDFTVKRDEDAPNNGFRFSIATESHLNASAIVYMDNVTGGSSFAKSVPAFISPTPYISGSHTSLIPVKKLTVFFQQKIQTGTMTTSSETNAKNLDFTKDEDKHQHWFLDDHSNWKRIK